MKRLDGYHYGGYLSFDLAERWAMDVGMRSYGGNGSHQQWTVPIIRPSYKHNGREINADFGGMFQQIVKGLKQNNDCCYMDSAMRMDNVHEFMRESAL